MIVIVDYGMGNLGSIKNMLGRLGVQSTVTSDPAAVVSAAKLILPGVGAFDNAMTRLANLGLVEALNEAVLRRRVPVLGICLGMQLMSSRSEEGQLPGLGWIDAETVRFRFDGERTSIRVPHMGWNTLQIREPRSVLRGLPEDSRFYFVHSYHVCCRNEADVLAATDYGVPFHSVIGRGHIVGTQFHPEKSHRFGMHVLRNFAEPTA
ncbi:MAG: imidazole glycerol phosphate synthase subunit HisH [Bacteroidales bacterium]